MEEFPANSKKAKEANKSKADKPKEDKTSQNDKDLKKVIKGKAVERKKPFSEKVHDVFIGGELKSAGSYILSEVLLPAFRNMIVEATTKGIERMIYGDRAPHRSSGSFGRGRISYQTPVDRYAPNSRGFLPGQSSQVLPNRQNINDILLNTREDAEIVLEQMGAILEQYNVVSVGDLKALVELPSNYVDQNWGWFNLKYADIRQTRDGWLINFPPIEPI